MNAQNILFAIGGGYAAYYFWYTHYKFPSRSATHFRENPDHKNYHGFFNHNLRARYAHAAYNQEWGIEHINTEKRQLHSVEQLAMGNYYGAASKFGHKKLIDLVRWAPRMRQSYGLTYHPHNKKL